MKFGYLTTFSEDELKRASSIGFDALEVHARSWGEDLATAGGRKKAAAAAKDLLDQYGMSISAVAHYSAGGTVKERVAAYRGIIDFCKQLGVGVIATLAGSDPETTIEDSLKGWTKVFSQVAKIATDNRIKIAFENWPGLRPQFPMKTVNIAFMPRVWDMMFDAVPSKALGLEFDPSHFVWQGIDYLETARRFMKRIYHVHAKDTEIREDRLKQDGFFTTGWWRYRIPGFGVVKWAEFISVLREGGYDGGIAIEHEDQVFWGPRHTEGLQLGYNNLRPLICV